ncbi:ferredoxin-thioredoxin reductase, variable chain-like [Punica granatum]|uniref:Ferredoxin-thioredoxin reductase, variable chain-like n=1 Tax=Punica granatum TaxID=22663 RepID=A0A218WJJ5_PUNGR|nr:ferredoxin-thioredoxin reductase, variable chain-like [Punica granatum]OWM72629.1 hypothetical protein CDL15_Pgr013097 [Punica granatum]
MSTTTTTLALLSPAAGTRTAAAISSRPSTCLFFSPPSSSSSVDTLTAALTRRRWRIRCEVALKPSDSEASTSPSSAEEDEFSSRIGARVRVTAPVKVYHVPRVPEVDLTGMEGVLKQNVAIWKGKRVSANLPLKVEFVKDIEGRGPVKFFAHLKEDEFEFI